MDTTWGEAIDIPRQAERSLELMIARKPTKSHPRRVGSLRLNGKKQPAVQPTLHQLPLMSGFVTQKRLSCKKNSKHVMSLNGKY